MLHCVCMCLCVFAGTPESKANPLLKGNKSTLQRAALAAGKSGRHLLGSAMRGSAIEEGEEDEGPPVEEEIEDEGYDDAVRTSPLSVFGQGQTAWEVGSKRGIFSAMCGAFSDQRVSSCEAETA